LVASALDIAQLSQRHRLAQTIIHSGRQVTLGLAAAHIGAERDDRDREATFAMFDVADRRGQFEPVHLRHVHVGDDQAIGSCAITLERHPAVLRQIGSVADPRQLSLDHHLTGRVVLGDQDEIAAGQGRLAARRYNFGCVWFRAGRFRRRLAAAARIGKHAKQRRLPYRLRQVGGEAHFQRPAAPARFIVGRQQN